MKEKIKYIIPFIICLAIFSVIFFCNGLYPFGSDPITHIDTDYIYIPTLYKIWDFLHHGGNIFYSDIGLGNSIYASLMIQGSLYSPLNLLLYFVKRDNIIYFFNVFIMIKICLIAVTSYIYIDKKYNKIHELYKIIFSILYTFNGFILFNYFNQMWLDIVILFPLLALYLDKLLNNENDLGYIIVLALMFIITFYFSYFVLIFIIIYSFIRLFIIDKKNNKEIIFKLGKGTVIALLISCFSSLPFLFQMFISGRYNIDFSTGILSNITMKSMYVLVSPLFIILSVKLISKFRNNKNMVFGYLLLLVLYLMPILIDPINALIHGGSYWSFPYRYGFITTFIMMDMGLYYISKYIKDKKIKEFSISDIACVTFAILFGVMGIVINNNNRSSIISNDVLLRIDGRKYFILIVIVLLVFLMYILGLLIKNRNVKYILLGITSVYAVGIFSSWTIFYNGAYNVGRNAQDMYKSMELVHDGRYRAEYKNVSTYYGYIMDIDTLDNWVHMLPEHVLMTYSNMGYYTHGYEVYGAGGTIFSDWLFNIRNVFVFGNKNNDDMYGLISDYGFKKLYKYNYSNNNGVVFNKLDDIKYTGIFEYQNKIYQSLFDTDENIIDMKTYNLDNKNNVITYKVLEPGYLYLDNYTPGNISFVKIDDEYIYDLDNCIKLLGYYEKDAQITFYFNSVGSAYFKLGFIKKSDIENLESPVVYKNNKYYVEGNKNKYLYLPINNIKGIKVYNNGKLVDTYNYLNNFISIKLNDGENVISVKYSQPLFKLGVILSIIGVLLLIIRKKIIPNKLVLNISYYAFMVLGILVFLYYYLYPLFKYVV